MIEGIPEGWELVRVGQVFYQEHYINNQGEVERWRGGHPSLKKGYLIVQKVEQPKQYRPFANAAEFEPNKDRWILNATIDDPRAVGMSKITAFDDEGVTLHSNIHFTYGGLFELDIRFDNYQPFGVEVQDE